MFPRAPSAKVPCAGAQEDPTAGYERLQSAGEELESRQREFDSIESIAKAIDS
jgi:hypothetical protein